jgi:acyl-ACP thioesterase
VDPSLPRPEQGRTFVSSGRIRLADMDERGRLRLDAVARFLQDVAIEDVSETGWGPPDHLWVVRRIRIEGHEPFLRDRAVELVTWCSSLAAIAAGRRWSVTGDAGGRCEVDSVWIHLGPDQRPARIEGFDAYAAATGGRSASTRLELPAPGDGALRRPWPLRASDVDLHGHVNNAVYWQAVEDALRDAPSGPLDPAGALVAELEYRDPVDLADRLELVTSYDGDALAIGFGVDGDVRAVARVAALHPPRPR